MVAADVEQSLEGRKNLGAFYTPRWLANALASWALDGGDGNVLDPSFGGCAFLDAALKIFQLRNPGEAPVGIFGVDVDDSAWRFAGSLIHQGVPPRNLRRGSFLDPKILNSLPMFTAIVGNPPYLRHHALSDSAIEAAQALLAQRGISLPRLASAWAYFVLVSAQQLAPSGRLAFILPGALLHTYYGKVVLHELQRLFGAIHTIHSHERFFQGTNEETVVLLAVDRGAPMLDAATYTRVADRNQLLRALGARSTTSGIGDFKLSLLPPEAIDAWHRVSQILHAPCVSEVARVRIGVVTGANDFFVRRYDDPILSVKDVRAVDVVTKNRWVREPRVTREMMRELEQAGHSTKLAIIGKTGRIHSRLREQLATAQREGIANRYHCRNREPWYRINDVEYSDMFFGYLNNETPILSKNDARALCTNGIHRVDALDARDIPQMVTASHTSFFEVQCELYGRNYGGGILKLEPSEAKKLRVPLGLDIIDALSKARVGEERRSLADRSLATRYGIAAADLEVLHEGSQVLRRARSVKRPQLLASANI